MRTLLIGALLTVGAVAAVPGGAPASAAQGRAAASAGAAGDTLRYQVRAGQPLLAALPARHNGQPASYRLVRGPALSWLVDHGFYWRTLPSESGSMSVLVRRVAPGVPPDTLVLQVTLTPAGG